MSTTELDHLITEVITRRLSASQQERLRASAQSLLQEASSSLDSHSRTLQTNIDAVGTQLRRGDAAVQELRDLQQRQVDAVRRIKELAGQGEAPLEETQQGAARLAQKLAEIEVESMKWKVVASDVSYDPDNARVRVQLENRKLYNLTCCYALVLNSLKQQLWPELNIVLTGSEKKLAEVQLLQALTAGVYALQIFAQEEPISNQVFFTVV